MAKVSICIPAYNNVLSLRRLFKSIEIQTYKDYEVIVTDDSTDDAIARLAEEKKYIRYFKNEKRLGSTANWNAAVEKSSGEYVKIMHHDDWFTDENSLQAFVSLLEDHPEADMAFSGTIQAQECNSFARCISKKDAQLIKSDYRNLYLGNTIGAPSAVMVRRKGDVFPKYDEKLKWLVDMEYYMGVLKNNPRFAYTEQPLITIGIGSGQLTEQCRDDLELNAYEYGYIYEKYDLKEEMEYKSKLIEILIQAGKNYKDAEEYGIPEREYKRVQADKLISKVKWKMTHILNERFWAFFFLVIFVISMIPVFMLSGINQATGDDLGYGKLTHEVWLNTHSLTAVIKAACQTVENYYAGWQGTWTSIFLFAFQPEVFSPDAYVIVPFLMTGIFCSATGILSYYLLVKLAGGSRYSYIIITVLLVTTMIQFLPSTKSGIFWYNGAAHYVIPYGAALLGIYFFLYFMNEGKIRAYIGMLLCMLLLGGMNYQAALLAPIVMSLSLLFYYRNKQIKRTAAFLLSLVMEMVGLVISMRSPGNRNRGGEDFGFSIGLALKTILECFIQGTVQIGEYFVEHPFLILFFAAAALFIWHMFTALSVRKKYPYPAVFVFFSYCVYCAMFAPQIYAGVDVSGGVYNMNYYIFILMIFSSMFYVEGWLAYRLERRDIKWINKNKVIISMVAAMVLLAVLFKGTLRETTTFSCIEYMSSGQAADFKRQMKEQKTILLDDSIKDAIVPDINDNQGPLMHMPITSNPEAWTNTVTKDFYGKDSVVSIPKEEWVEMYK